MFAELLAFRQILNLLSAFKSESVQHGNCEAMIAPKTQLGLLGVPSLKRVLSENSLAIAVITFQN